MWVPFDNRYQATSCSLYAKSQSPRWWLNSARSKKFWMKYTEINKNVNFCCFVKTISFCTHTFPALSLPVTPFINTSEFPGLLLLTTERLNLSKCGSSDFLKGGMEGTGSAFNCLACCSQEPHCEMKLTEPKEKVNINLGSNVHEKKDVCKGLPLYIQLCWFIDWKGSLYSSEW